MKHMSETRSNQKRSIFIYHTYIFATLSIIGVVAVTVDFQVYHQRAKGIRRQTKPSIFCIQLPPEAFCVANIPGASYVILATDSWPISSVIHFVAVFSRTRNGSPSDELGNKHTAKKDKIKTDEFQWEILGMGQRDGIVAGSFTSMGVNGRELCGRSAIWQLDVPYNATPNGHGVTKSMPIFSFFGATMATWRFPSLVLILTLFQLWKETHLAQPHTWLGLFLPKLAIIRMGWSYSIRPE